jgi:YHS domain-containing protein
MLYPKNKNFLLLLTFVFFLSASISALVAKEVAPINTGESGIAIKSYDVVAYFSEGAPVEGTAEFSHRWMEVEWRFSSQAHLDLFKENPGKYAPQYGGYCAWAVSNGYTAPVDPEAWKIVEGKLYLNYNEKIRKKWLKNQDELIKKADENWPGLVEPSSEKG